MKAALVFSAGAAALIAITAWILSFFFRGPDDTRAIVLSAVLALVVQIGTFVVLRALRGPSFMIGWGLGSLTRFAAVIVWGFLAQPVLALPMSAALFSLASFLVVTSMLEPVLLNR